MQTKHIIKMSIELVEHARNEIGHDIVSLTVWFDLSSVDRMIDGG